MRKLPASVLEANGAFEKDPQRRRKDPVTTGELGRPPAYFDDAQKAMWKELKAQMPQGLAKSADRWLCEVACRYMLKFRTTGLNASELAQLINALGRLGCTPADRSKCAMPVTKEKKGNEFTEFSSTNTQ